MLAYGNELQDVPLWTAPGVVVVDNFTWRLLQERLPPSSHVTHRRVGGRLLLEDGSTRYYDLTHGDDDDGAARYDSDPGGAEYYDDDAAP
eukprot:2297086-Rhodomonas_salina.1